MSLYSFFKNFHSGFRYLVLLIIVIAIIQALFSWINKKQYTERAKKINLIAIYALIIEMLFGVATYILGGWYNYFSNLTELPKSIMFITIPHWVIMIIAFLIIRISYSKTDSIDISWQKHRLIFISYSLGLILIGISVWLAGLK